MTKQNFTLQREFVKWFFEEQYPELGSNRAQVYGYSAPQTKDARDYWMREAYMAGARTMAQETTDILAAWACAVEGLELEVLTPAEVFDRARENLHDYNKTVLSKT